MAKRRTHVAARIATVGLGAVLLFLAGFAMWSAITSQHAAARLRKARLLSNAYEQTRFAMDDERLLEHEYLIGHGGNYTPARSEGLHRRFDALASQVDMCLAEIGQYGDAQDRRLARQLAAEQRDYHRWMDAVFASAQMGNNGMAQMRGTLADKDFTRLRDEMSRLTDAHDAAALRQLNELHDTEGRIRAATWVAIGVAMVLFGIFALTLRGYRRREAAVTQAELARLERQVLIDNLTELRNNRAFEEDLTQDLARSDRSGKPLTLVFLDLDGLKQTNDSHGHQAGDVRLRALADAMREAVRAADGAYRVAGDEFALVLPQTRAMGGFETAQRVQKALRRVTGGPATVTAGVAEAEPGIGRDELIRKADLALIEAKCAHRGVLIYSPEMDHGGEKRAGDFGRVALASVASSLARAVDAKDSSTRSHSETVAEICALVATELGLDPDRISQLRLAGLLHDVGKIGIPDAILTKPGPLTEREFEVMKTHSVLGQGIVGATGLSQQADWILHHHERIDGGGYPDGLAMEEIPLESRIILVADAFEAMTRDRPYRDGCAEAEALSELKRHAGTQFDPHCVEALENVLLGRSGELRLAAIAGQSR
jgi:diguanylate cyclase (GGDEF)-like protein